MTSRPIGPSQRTYANAAAVISTKLKPPALLAQLHAIERKFGRKRNGQRWRARALDLDIILWSGGIWITPTLSIPHPAFRERAFVLKPAARIAPLWRDPLTGHTLRQLALRLDRERPCP
jgi:2-amino-4-hydroxy-6-hydroxymethyldihydropteridine diphosphokinase